MFPVLEDYFFLMENTKYFRFLFSNFFLKNSVKKKTGINFQQKSKKQTPPKIIPMVH